MRTQTNEKQTLDNVKEEAQTAMAAASGAGQAGLVTGGSMGAIGGSVTGWGIGAVQGVIVGLVVGVFMGIALYKR